MSPDRRAAHSRAHVRGDRGRDLRGWTRKGKHVMTHANAGEGIDNAVRAGVRSVEHGLWLSEEQAATTMAESNCWLVPDARDPVRGHRLGGAGADPRVLGPQGARAEADPGRGSPRGEGGGVKIALGTDYISRDQHGKNLIELVHMREAGLSPEECLLAATISGPNSAASRRRTAGSPLATSSTPSCLTTTPATSRSSASPTPCGVCSRAATRRPAREARLALSRSHGGVVNGTLLTREPCPPRPARASRQGSGMLPRARWHVRRAAAPRPRNALSRSRSDSVA